MYPQINTNAALIENERDNATPLLNIVTMSSSLTSASSTWHPVESALFVIILPIFLQDLHIVAPKAS